MARWRTNKCKKETERQLRRRDVEMSNICGNTDFRLYREEGDEMVEVVENFNYIKQTLYQTNDDWPAVRQNIMCARSVWGRLGTLLRREGVDHKVSEMFYRAVAQVLLLFVSETWVLLAEMERKVEREHTGFLKQVMRKQAQRIADRTWETPGVEVVQEATGTYLAMTYIGRRQATMEHWVELRPIFEVCADEKGREGESCRREAWWRQEAAEKQLREILEEILR